MNSVRTVAVIGEVNYAANMQEIVEPFLSESGKDGYFEGVKSGKIHYEAYFAQQARANIVISHGFTESAEKFREMSYYYVKEGYNVFALDHRGHGLSCREKGDLTVVKISDFYDYIEDLNLFIEKIVKPASQGLPLYLYAHSMGGAVAALYLQRYPDVFQKAVLNAPMIVPLTGGYPIAVTKIMVGFFKLIGKGRDRVFTDGPFNPNASFQNSCDTSEARFEYYKAKRIQNVMLQTCAPSYNWVANSLKIIRDLLDDKKCARIKARTLLLQAENDKSVQPEPQKEFIAKVKNGKFIQIKNSKHEIYMSTNDVLENYLDIIFEFFAQD